MGLYLNIALVSLKGSLRRMFLYMYMLIIVHYMYMMIFHIKIYIDLSHSTYGVYLDSLHRLLVYTI